MQSIVKYHFKYNDHKRYVSIHSLMDMMLVLNSNPGRFFCIIFAEFGIFQNFAGFLLPSGNNRKLFCLVKHLYAGLYWGLSILENCYSPWKWPLNFPLKPKVWQNKKLIECPSGPLCYLISLEAGQPVQSYFSEKWW